MKLSDEPCDKNIEADLTNKLMQENSFKCEYCETISKTLKLHRMHLSRWHLEEIHSKIDPQIIDDNKKHKCHLCLNDKIFDSRLPLNSHLRYDHWVCHLTFEDITKARDRHFFNLFSAVLKN